jgi:nuclear pore complex protein Nup93
VTDDELARLTSGANGASSSSSSASRLGMSSLGASALGASRLGTSVRRFPLAQSTLSKTSVESREGGLVMHNKRIKYEKVVNSLNLHRMRKEPFEVCRAFEATVKDIRDDQKLSMLPSAFEILSCMTQEPSSRNDLTPGAAIAQRQYASAYLSAPGSNASSLLNGRLTDGARNYLEQDFERYIDSTIARNPKEAALGGVPGIANKVRAYVDVTLRTREAIELFKVETVGGIKLWAHVYYLVRAGYPAEALSLVESHQGSVKKDDWSFPGCFKAWLSSPDRRLPKAQRDQLYNDFNAHVRNSANVDQFKYALYKLVGRFEIGRKAVKAAVTTEDWIWYQLALTRENKDGDAPQDKFDLADLAQTIFKHGADKFDANGTRPLAWFRLLLLTAQFERAIAYLYSKPALKTDAVHFAVALQYYGLLRVPAKSSEAEICEFRLTLS